MSAFRTCAKLALGATFVLAGMSWSGTISPSSPGDLFSPAEARVGRPLTPVSYAGVARRTTRRAVAVGAAAHPVAAPTTTVVVAAPTYPPECVRAVDSTGATVYRCP